MRRSRSSTRRSGGSIAAIDALGDLPDYVEEDDPAEDKECQAVREQYEQLCQADEELESQVDNLLDEGLITEEEKSAFYTGNAPAKRTWLLQNHDLVVRLRDEYKAREEERERREREEEATTFAAWPRS